MLVLDFGFWVSGFRTQSHICRIPTERFTPRSHGPPWECRPASLKDSRLQLRTITCFFAWSRSDFPPASIMC